MNLIVHHIDERLKKLGENTFLDTLACSYHQGADWWMRQLGIDTKRYVCVSRDIPAYRSLYRSTPGDRVIVNN